MIFAGASAYYFDFLGNTKAGIKSDAKLANQISIFLFVTGQAFQKGRRAGARDGAEIFDQLIMVHADAVVSNSNTFGFLIDRQRNAKLGARIDQIVFGERQITQFIARVRRVGNQLAQKDYFVAVK